MFFAGSSARMPFLSSLPPFPNGPRLAPAIQPDNRQTRHPRKRERKKKRGGGGNKNTPHNATHETPPTTPDTPSPPPTPRSPDYRAGAPPPTRAGASARAGRSMRRRGLARGRRRRGCCLGCGRWCGCRRSRGGRWRLGWGLVG